jgi:hypothetical protein
MTWTATDGLEQVGERPRIFILCAGFSVPAGLPTSRELLGLVRRELRSVGHDGHLEGSLEDYIAFKKATTGLAPAEIDIEDLLIRPRLGRLDATLVSHLLSARTWRHSQPSTPTNCP